MFVLSNTPFDISGLGCPGQQKPFEEPGSEAPVHFSHRAASNLPIPSAKVDSRLSQLSSLLLLPCLLRRGTQKMFLLPRAPYPTGIIYCGSRTNIPTDCFLSHRGETKNVSNMHNCLRGWRFIGVITHSCDLLIWDDSCISGYVL